MICEQTRLDFETGKRPKANFVVWQQEIATAAPWCVVFDGYPDGRADVTIYNDHIPRGKVTFPDLKLESAHKFADFVVTMLGVYKGFGGAIEVRPQDYKALLVGYREGVYRAVRAGKETNRKG